ncbi:SDR family oxidoreductase [Sphingobacterium sp. DR205]|uniref:SDR family NAD(P)-dependent oxidoreductase n=1 Tax=Sphingobacterium sp. DR205 TaxID=2713573 RepID=UPI0013E45005|nr:SDR family oxidoreductase [Sphingobacterium sp. DR205]QIH35551.1 SDR family oxidoreductase [Sphingobacterium sp. DR205]
MINNGNTYNLQLTRSRLKEKVALITGGGSGIGEATAKLFTSEGASVMITGTREEKLKKVTKDIQSNGGNTLYAIQDVSKEADWEKTIQALINRFGKIDILVNNAGITGDLLASLPDRTAEEFMQVLSTNLLGPFLGIKTAVPFMQKGASIVNVSSIAGITGNAGGNAYTASKGGSRMLSKGAAIELAKQGIRVNSIHPGYVETPMVQDMRDANAFREMAVGSTPLGRGASPDEMAMGILFLASEESSFMTGAELIIDGGFTAF